METTSCLRAEFVDSRLARLSLTLESWVSLKINCKVCGSVDSKCMNGLRFSPSGYGVFILSRVESSAASEGGGMC